jgi:hypothetical protein
VKSRWLVFACVPSQVLSSSRFEKMHHRPCEILIVDGPGFERLDSHARLSSDEGLGGIAAWQPPNRCPG